MPGIEELVGGDQQPHQSTFNSVESARVASVAGSQITVLVPTFSADQAYATVPFIPASASPSEGDAVVLHSDSNGNPIYAAVFS